MFKNKVKKALTAIVAVGMLASVGAMSASAVPYDVYGSSAVGVQDFISNSATATISYGAAQYGPATLTIWKGSSKVANSDVSIPTTLGTTVTTTRSGLVKNNAYTFYVKPTNDDHTKGNFSYST